MLSLKIFHDTAFFIHNTRDDTIGFIKSDGTAKLHLEFPQHVFIYRPSTLPPELRQRFETEYPRVDFNFKN